MRRPGGRPPSGHRPRTRAERLRPGSRGRIGASAPGRTSNAGRADERPNDPRARGAKPRARRWVSTELLHVFAGSGRAAASVTGFNGSVRVGPESVPGRGSRARERGSGRRSRSNSSEGVIGPILSPVDALHLLKVSKYPPGTGSVTPCTEVGAACPLPASGTRATRSPSGDSSRNFASWREPALFLEPANSGFRGPIGLETSRRSSGPVGSLRRTRTVAISCLGPPARS